MRGFLAGGLCWLRVRGLLARGPFCTSVSARCRLPMFFSGLSWSLFCLFFFGADSRTEFFPAFRFLVQLAERDSSLDPSLDSRADSVMGKRRRLELAR